MTFTSKPASASLSETTTTLACGFNARFDSIFALTASSAISLSCIYICPLSNIRTEMTSDFFCSFMGDLVGRFTSIEISLTNEVVTMKKISMMKTISSMGVILISLSSFFFLIRLLILTTH